MFFLFFFSSEWNIFLSRWLEETLWILEIPSDVSQGIYLSEAYERLKLKLGNS